MSMYMYMCMYMYMYMFMYMCMYIMNQFEINHSFILLMVKLPYCKHCVRQ